MWDALGTFILSLFRPLPGEGVQQYIHRALIWVALIIIGLHIAWACNFFYDYGLPGFVSIVDLKSTNSQLGTMIIGDSARDIVLNRTRECAAIKATPPNYLARNYAQQAWRMAVQTCTTAGGSATQCYLPTCDEVAGGENGNN